jgi:hypothetical protein
MSTDSETVAAAKLSNIDSTRIVANFHLENSTS